MGDCVSLDGDLVRALMLSSVLLGSCRHSDPISTPPESVVASGSPVTVTIDPDQVPHVFASSDEGLAYGLGWAQLRAYPEEILRLYALARGDGAQRWGERYRRSDRLVRMLDLPDRAEAALAARPAAIQRELAAFAQGMNDYARAHPERLSEAARTVLPVRATDPVGHGTRMVLAFMLLVGQRPLLLTLGGEVFPGVAGSNVWAIGPSRSASGHALLLANPHLPWNLPALRFFEAHLVGPARSQYGVTLIGFPVLVTGWNDDLAWSLTVNTVDTADLFVIDPVPGGYRLDGRTRPWDEYDVETIVVRQPDGTMASETVEIRRSIHGPVVQLDNGRLFAVRTGIDDDAGSWIDTYRGMGRAHDLASFEDAMRRAVPPLFTVGYVDRDGHVLYVSGGRVLRRPFDDWSTWRVPVAGDRSDLLGEGIHPYESLPRVVDPPSGFVQNANSVPWLATVPSPLTPADHPGFARGPISMRERHSLRLLLADDSIEFEELRAMQRSAHLELSRHVLDELVIAAGVSGSLTARRGGDVLAGWDGQAKPDARGAALFEAWAARALGSGERPLFAVPPTNADPLGTPWGLADPERAVELLEEAVREVETRHGAVDAPWGQTHRLRDDLLGVGAPGELGSFHVVEYVRDSDSTWIAERGDTFVALVEMRPEGPHAEVMLVYGNVSPESPWASDQLDRLAHGRLRRPRLRPTEIERDAVEVHVLPGPAKAPSRNGAGTTRDGPPP